MHSEHVVCKTETYTRNPLAAAVVKEMAISTAGGSGGPQVAVPRLTYRSGARMRVGAVELPKIEAGGRGGVTGAPVGQSAVYSNGVGLGKATLRSMMVTLVYYYPGSDY